MPGAGFRPLPNSTPPRTTQGHCGGNDPLFDITGCNVSTTPSRQHRSEPVEFITGCHWHAEREFADYSTPVLGSAETKPLVAARRNDAGVRQSVLTQCADIPVYFRTNVFFLFVSHPRDWLDDPHPPMLYEWIAGDWQPILSQSG